ncbi:MAG: radical SAM protein [Nitrospirae bacterium]|nr:MAG: radical SAM protein [Nitrospirota bacterium]
MQVRHIPCQTIINPTGGYLEGGFTHTINLYRGCALGNTLCGLYCYAQWNPYHVQGRKWGAFLDIKEGVTEIYRQQYDRLKHPRSGEPKPLHIFMSSVTEPYPPQERKARRTRQLLEEMVHRPPDFLVIQTHTPLVADDLAVLLALHERCRLQINITVETDKLQLPPPFPPHAYSPESRIQALHTLHAHGLVTVATVSPLLPLDNPWRFARDLEAVSNQVVLDHYLLGDGSPQGLRTKQTELPRLLKETGFDDWNTLEKFEAIVGIFREVFKASPRVGVSREGFTASGKGAHL